MHRLKQLAIATLCTLSCAQAAATPAQSQKQADKAVEQRKAVFTLMVSNIGPLAAMQKGQIPMDNAMVERNAERMKQLGMMIEDYFRLDTSGFTTDTEALEKIWSNKADFVSKADDLILAAETLQLAARADSADLGAAIGAVRKTCGSCHDDYKKD